MNCAPAEVPCECVYNRTHDGGTQFRGGRPSWFASVPPSHDCFLSCPFLGQDSSPPTLITIQVASTPMRLLALSSATHSYGPSSPWPYVSLSRKRSPRGWGSRPARV